MTDVVRTDELSVVWLDDRRVMLSGPPARVGAAVVALREAGRLVRTNNPAPTGTGGVLVTVTVIPETPPAAPAPPPAASPWTPRIVLALAAIVGAVFITCGVLALRGLAWAGAHERLLLGLAAVIVLGALCLVVNAVTGGRLVEVVVRVRVK